MEGSAGQTTGAAGGEGSEAARRHRARSPGLPGTRLVTVGCQEKELPNQKGRDCVSPAKVSVVMKMAGRWKALGS